MLDCAAPTSDFVILPPTPDPEILSADAPDALISLLAEGPAFISLLDLGSGFFSGFGSGAFSG